MTTLLKHRDDIKVGAVLTCSGSPDTHAYRPIEMETPVRLAQIDAKLKHANEVLAVVQKFAKGLN